MSDTKHAGRYVAADRGAFEPRAQQQTDAPDPKPVTATLETIVMMHMSDEQAVRFWRYYGSLD